MSRLHTTSGPRRVRHVVLIAVGFFFASSGVAYAYFSATGSGTYALAKAGALSVPSLSLVSKTETSAVLTWTAPTNPAGTTWAMKETGATGSGACFAATPTPGCTVSGLTASTTYHLSLTYTLDSWLKTSNTLAVTTTATPPPSSCGGTLTVKLAKGTPYTFTLIGGGGGNGAATSRGHASGGSGAAGAKVTGSLESTTTATVTLRLVRGCKGGTATGAVEGTGGTSRFALGGAGGVPHATPKSGAGGGGGGASAALLTVNGTTHVIAVASGGGGGGGAAFTNGKSGTPGTKGTTVLITKPSPTKATGAPGTSPTTGHPPGGGGGGGGVTTAAKGGTPGKGGTGGFDYTTATLPGITLTVTAPVTGGNPDATGSVSDSDPPVLPLLGTAVPPMVTAISPATGPTSGGTGVVVQGSGFTETTTVSFGTTPATSVTVTSVTSLLATSPPHPQGRVNVVVKSPTGTSPDSPSDVFTYTSLAPPVVTGISPSTGTVGGKTEVVLTGTGFTSTAKVNFGTQPASSVTVTGPSVLTVVAPPHPPGAVTVTVTTPSGTSAGSAADQFTYTPPPGGASGTPGTTSGTPGATSSTPGGTSGTPGTTPGTSGATSGTQDTTT